MDLGKLMMNEGIVTAKYYITPWMKAGSMGLVHAPRGIGKTMFTLSLAYRASIGEQFLGWCTNKAKVLFVDAEMTASVMRKRARQIYFGLGIDKMPEDIMLHGRYDSKDGTIANIADPEAQQIIYDPLFAQYDIIILDNEGGLSYDVPGFKNESETVRWARVQTWLTRWKNEGKSILLVHHTNKAGTGQLGTSARENCMDYIIGLRKAISKDPDHGGFCLHWEKVRDKNPGETYQDLQITFHTEPSGFDDWGIHWQYEPLEQLLVRCIQEKYEKLKNWNHVQQSCGIDGQYLHNLRCEYDIKTKKKEENKDIWGERDD